MKFGHVDTAELELLDLTLPPDHEDNALLLNNTSNSSNPLVYVGCAKWNRKEWIGSIYPEGTKSKDFLTECVKHFNSVELNTTFFSWKRNSVED